MAYFTVVIPLYNKERYISRAVESVLRQTYADFELIVIDDGSKDAGPVVVEALHDGRLRMRRQANAGVSAARNRGIREAKGKVVAFLDADDEWEPEFLENISFLASAYPEAGMFTTGLRQRYRDFAVETLVNHPEDEQGTSFLLGRYFNLAARYLFVTSSNVAIRRELFETVGLFAAGADSGEDRDMWARVALCGPVAYARKVLATYHCEALGRSCCTRPLHLSAPPDIDRLKSCLGQDCLPAELKADVRLYLKKRVLQLVSDHLIHGHFQQAQDILRRERGILQNCPEYFWYLMATKIMTPATARLIERILLSRTLFILQAKIRKQQFVQRYV